MSGARAGAAGRTLRGVGIITNRKEDEGVGVANMNKHGIITAFNDVCVDIFGISSAEAPGRAPGALGFLSIYHHHRSTSVVICWV